MTGDGLQHAVVLESVPHGFYTNGDVIVGSLLLTAAHRPKSVTKITTSLICEEWVHTTRLEFKEHFHSTTTAFDVARNPMDLRPGHSATVPFELAIPKDEDLRLPPSFDLKHNIVAWKVRVLISHAADAAGDAGVVQAEQPIRLCRRSTKLRPALESTVIERHRRHAQRTDFVAAKTSGDRGETAAREIQNILTHAIHAHHLGNEPHRRGGEHQAHGAEPHAPPRADLGDVALDIELGVPTHGLVQTPLRDGPTLGLRLSIDAAHGGLELREVALDIVNRVVTVGKDAYEDVKPVTRVRQVHAVEPGPNNFSDYVSRVRLHGVTEAFETDWQELSHRLRVTLAFGVVGTKHIVKLPWEVPAQVLSEAYGR